MSNQQENIRLYDPTNGTPSLFQPPPPIVNTAANNIAPGATHDGDHQETMMSQHGFGPRQAHIPEFHRETPRDLASRACSDSGRESASNYLGPQSETNVGSLATSLNWGYQQGYRLPSDGDIPNFLAGPDYRSFEYTEQQMPQYNSFGFLSRPAHLSGPSQMPSPEIFAPSYGASTPTIDPSFAAPQSASRDPSNFGNPHIELDANRSHSHPVAGHQAQSGNRHMPALWGFEQAQGVFPAVPAAGTGYLALDGRGTPTEQDREPHQSFSATETKPATHMGSSVSNKNKIKATPRMTATTRKPKAASKSNPTPTKVKAPRHKVEKPVSRANRTPRTVGMKWQKLVEELAATPLPDYSNTDLLFATRDDAVEDAKERIKQLPTYWMPPAPDASIPQTLQERQAVVRRLLGALKDTSRAKDTDSKSFDTRWTTAGKRQYTDAALESTCWEILDLTERLHREGPTALSIQDANYLVCIKQSAGLTFEQRISLICMLVSEFKSRADTIIKGSALETTVGAPQEALSSARNNLVANKTKATQIAFAKENQPSQTGEKRKREVAESSIKNTNDQFTDDSPMNAAQSQLAAQDTPSTNGEAVPSSPASDTSDRSRKRARVSSKPRPPIRSPSPNC